MTIYVVLKKLQSLMIDLMTNIDAIYSANLVKFRKAKGYKSAESLAEVIEVSPRTIQRWEAGETLPPSEKIDEIAAKLGKQVQDFFIPGEAVVIGAPISMKRVAERIGAIPDHVYELTDDYEIPKDLWDDFIDVVRADCKKKPSRSMA
jgi:transcriptional regulator with XRE-family HTH domain